MDIKRCINIIQPDVSHCGGITNLLNIARMAESYDVALAPHCSLGPIAFASCLHVDACCVNFVFQESSINQIQRNQSILHQIQRNQS